MCKILPRLKLLAENEGITIGALERIIGASKGVLSRALANGTDIQSKWLEAVVENYPQYSEQWLLTGSGDMIKKINNSSEVPKKQLNVIQNIETRPRIPFEAAAGTLSFAANGVRSSDCEMVPVVQSLPYYDFSIIARGDSMIPDIYSGDELACRFVDNSSFIQWGRTYVLDTAQGVVVKKIFDSSDDILCRSSNRDYPDFSIPKTDLYHMALVVGLIRQL